MEKLVLQGWVVKRITSGDKAANRLTLARFATPATVTPETDGSAFIAALMVLFKAEATFSIDMEEIEDRMGLLRGHDTMMFRHALVRTKEDPLQPFAVRAMFCENRNTAQ